MSTGTNGGLKNSTDQGAESTVHEQRHGVEAKRVKVELPERPARVLVADDEYLVAAEITHTLSQLGHIVVGPATDGEAAITLAKSALPDMAMVDVRMPKRDGISVARELYEHMGIPVLIVSAYSDKETVEAASQTGVFGYIVKPASADQIRAAINVGWERFRRHVMLEAEASNLKRRLEERRFIEQAKWILVQRKGVTEPEAMTMLQKKARDSRRPMIDIARSIVDAEGMLGTA